MFTVFPHVVSAEIQIQKISTIGNQPIANIFHDQTISIADCENLTIGHSLAETILFSNFDIVANSISCYNISIFYLNLEPLFCNIVKK